MEAGHQSRSSATGDPSRSRDYENFLRQTRGQHPDGENRSGWRAGSCFLLKRLLLKRVDLGLLGKTSPYRPSIRCGPFDNVAFGLLDSTGSKAGRLRLLRIKLSADLLIDYTANRRSRL